MREKPYELISDASNPNTKKDVFLQLSDINDEDIRASLIRNPKCPSNVLRKLFLYYLIKRDDNKILRIVEHPNCSCDDIVSFYINYTNSLKSIDPLQEGYINSMLNRLFEVVKNPRCSKETLEVLKSLRNHIKKSNFDDKKSISIDFIIQKEQKISKMAKFKLNKARKFHNTNNNKVANVIRRKL